MLQIKKFFFLPLIALFLTPSLVFAGQDIEQNFKRISLEISKDFKEHVGQRLSDDQLKEENERSRKRYNEWITELKNLKIQEPNSIWSDDAQYLICIMYAGLGDNQAQKKELESLLKQYPDFHIEDWTKQNLQSMIPSNVSVSQTMQELCYIYLSLKEVDEMKSLAENGMKRFPEETDRFKQILELAKSGGRVAVN